MSEKISLDSSVAISLIPQDILFCFLYVLLSYGFLTLFIGKDSQRNWYNIP